MRKLYCYSLNEFKRLVKNNDWDKKLPDNVAIISILNSEKVATDDEIHMLSDSDQVLNLEFDDITTNDLVIANVVLFSKEMAEQSYKFIKQNINEGRDFYIHCSAGVSRSQAFVKFIKNNWSEIDWETRKENPCEFPNLHVSHMLNEEFRNND